MATQLLKSRETGIIVKVVADLRDQLIVEVVSVPKGYMGKRTPGIQFTVYGTVAQVIERKIWSEVPAS